MAIYKQDFEAVGGGFDKKIKGWGMEDVDFFERCIKSHLRVFRAPEPTLVHVFHPIQCNPTEMNNSQWKMCIGTKGQNIASLDYMAEQILKQLFSNT